MLQVSATQGIAARRYRASSISARERCSSEQVLDAWLGPDHRYFKLKGDDGDVYIIQQETASGTWELTLFRREK